MPTFNPRPREGGDAPRRSARGHVRVSIRAPAKGATTEQQERVAGDLVSIRAPAKGATGTVSPCPRTRGCFNPRPREGGDPAHLRSIRPSVAVSIRAPAKGATRGVPESGARIGVSIRAPAKGATAIERPDSR